MSGIMGAPGSMGGAAGMMEQQMMMASFRDFCERPENRPAVERQQRKEVEANLRSAQRSRAVDFRERVMASEPEAQRNIAPFLSSPVLRKIVQTFTNDPNNDFSKWALNPAVIAMLKQAQSLLDNGTLTEAEAEHLIMRHLTDPSNPTSAEMERLTKPAVRLATQELVGALNEHLQERRKGNEAYKARRFTDAMASYGRALAIVTLVRGQSGPDQAEVDANRAAVLLNIAAVHLETGEPGAAAGRCTEALTIQPMAAKALLRRAKAYRLQREYALAAADIDAVRQLDPYSGEADGEAAALAAARKADKEHDKGMFPKMLKI